VWESRITSIPFNRQHPSIYAPSLIGRILACHGGGGGDLNSNPTPILDLPLAGPIEIGSDNSIVRIFFAILERACSN
jgi:hypothetical protein